MVRELLHRLRLRGVLWRNRDFLWFWAAHTVSQFGSQVSSLALPLVAILVLDASAFEVAALGARNGGRRGRWRRVRSSEPRSQRGSASSFATRSSGRS